MRATISSSENICRTNLQEINTQRVFLTQGNFLVLDDLLKPFIIKSALGLYYNLDWSCSNDHGDIIFGNDIWECLGLTKEKNIVM